jgi:hypothetical protein
MAKPEKHGQKHRILFIPHSLNRLWRYLMFLDIVIWVVWWFAPDDPIFAPPRDEYLFYAGIAVLILMLFFFLIRRWGYVQARYDHVRIVVPFYRLKIPYSRIKTVRMEEFRKLFKYRKLKWADKRFLKPYFWKTVATLHLDKYPKSIRVIRFFMPNHMILPKKAGFLFLLKDYMAFVTEVDSRLNVYRDVSRPQEETFSIADLFGE